MNHPVLPSLGTLLLAALPATGQCMSPMPTPMAGPALALLDDRIYVAQGHGSAPSDLVDVYDLQTGTWSTETLSTPRWLMGTAAVGGRVFFVGGLQTAGPGPSTAPSAVVDVFDPATDTWSVEELSVARMQPRVERAGDVLVVAGGLSGGDTVKTVEVYDPAAGTWRTTALPISVVDTGPMVSVGTGVWFRGRLGTGEGRVLGYDGPTGTWTVLTPPVPRKEFGVGASGSRVVVAGGRGLVPPYDYSDRMDLYDTASGTWSTATMPVPLVYARCAPLGPYAVLAGGLGPYTHSDRLRAYDGRTGTWSSIPLPFAPTEAVWVSDGTAAHFALDADWLLSLSPRFPKQYCYGDGSGTPCPCGNAGAPRRGCASSASAGGFLELEGWTCLDQDDLAFHASGMVPGGVAMLFVGTQRVLGGSGAFFGDGLRCAGGAVIRLGLRTVDAGGAAVFGPGLAAQGGWRAGSVRRFQVWYRDLAGPCALGSNTTNAIEVEFGG